MDISENGRQIAEKLLVLLDGKQRKEAAEAIISRMGQNESAVKYPCLTRSVSVPFQYAEQPLTEIQEGGLYFYPELRKACVGDTEIELTVKEYDALHLLISNRILTYETLARQIWGEEYIDITTKTIHNLMSRVRHKLQVSPDTFNYIICVRSVGYKFDAGTKKRTKSGQF